MTDTKQVADARGGMQRPLSYRKLKERGLSIAAYERAVGTLGVNGISLGYVPHRGFRIFAVTPRFAPQFVPTCITCWLGLDSAALVAAIEEPETVIASFWQIWQGL